MLRIVVIEVTEGYIYIYASILLKITRKSSVNTGAPSTEIAAGETPVFCNLYSVTLLFFEKSFR